MKHLPLLVLLLVCGCVYDSEPTTVSVHGTAHWRISYQAEHWEGEGDGSVVLPDFTACVKVEKKSALGTLYVEVANRSARLDNAYGECELCP